MKVFSGTLKVEIVKPEGASWDEVGSRMRTLRRSLGPALNLSMRDVHADAVAEVSSIRRGDKPSREWRKGLEKSLRSHWSSEMARMFESDQRLFDARRLEREKQKRRPGKKKPDRPPIEPDARSYLPALEYLSAETIDLISSRFSGDHLRDLIAARSSFPSFRKGETFFARSRACRIEGKASEARIVFPLWGVGKKATVLVVAPSGGHARETWNRLVRDYHSRGDVVDLEKHLKEARSQLAAARKAGDDESLAQAAVREQERRLIEMGAYKLGRIGITYSEKKRKWFALVSWTRCVADVPGEGKAAALNFGVNVFVQALAEDGDEWSVAGTDILATRERFRARRRSIQRCKNHMGHGSRGRGKKRRELPLTRLDKKESNYVQSRIRQIASGLIRWCLKRGVGTLLIEDLSGMRDEFEKKTEGDAPEQLKRLIHSWPFHETRLAIERQGFEHGVAVQAVKPASGRRCPGCGHEENDNVSIHETVTDVMLYRRPQDEAVRAWRASERRSWFKCQVCHLKGRGDVVTCANMLLDRGYDHAMEKQQEKARKRAKSAIKSVKERER